MASGKDSRPEASNAPESRSEKVSEYLGIETPAATMAMTGSRVPTLSSWPNRHLRGARRTSSRESGMEVVDRIQNGLGLSFADAGRLLTVTEAAERMGLSARTLRRLVQQRKIRHLRIGRLIRISAWDVDGFVTDSTIEPGDDPPAGTDDYPGNE